MQVFYIDATIPADLKDYPLIEACYPQHVLLHAKTAKEAVDEAWRLQQDCDVTAWDLIERMRQEGRDWTKAYGLGPHYASRIYCYDSDSGFKGHVTGTRIIWIEAKSRKLCGRVFWFRTRPNDRGVYACEAKEERPFDFDGHPLPPDQLGLRIGAVPDTEEGNRFFEYEVNRIARNFYRKLLKGAQPCELAILYI